MNLYKLSLFNLFLQIFYIDCLTLSSFNFFTRYLGTLKSYVRNRSKPEGSIAQGYIAEECLTFCSLYLADYVESKLNRVSRNETADDNATSTLDVFTVTGHAPRSGKPTILDAETLKKAHQYILFNCEAVRPYIE